MKRLAFVAALAALLLSGPVPARAFWGEPYSIGQIPVRLFADPSMAPQCPQDFGPYKRAAKTWSTIAGSYFEFGYRFGPRSLQDLNAEACDGKNHIEFVPIGDPHVLAVTMITCAFGKRETGMQLNSLIPWSCSGAPGPGEIDLETVALHEMGHMLGLDHTPRERSIMYPMYMGVRRQLRNWDEEQVCTLYPIADWPAQVERDREDPQPDGALPGGPDPAP